MDGEGEFDVFGKNAQSSFKKKDVDGLLVDAASWNRAALLFGCLAITVGSKN